MVTAASDIAGLRRLWKLAFGDTDAFLDSFFGTAYSSDRCRFLKIDGQIAAALYWFNCQYDGQRAAYVYAVATHPDFRGRGLCRQLMTEIHGHLAAEGYDAVLLGPQDAGLRGMYAAMGYRDATSLLTFPCKAGAAVPLREVSAEEFAVLRRRFLPEGGVIQEEESLRFLSTYARFYAGDNFLATVSVDQIPELLGSRDAAPGILGALGLASGSVRTPGDGTPFAMFYPLKDTATMPAYLGFAFD